MTDLRTTLLAAVDKLRALGESVRRIPVTDANTQALLEVSVFHAQARLLLAQALLVVQEQAPRGRLIDLGMRRRTPPPFDLALEDLADGEGPNNAG